MAEPVTVGLLVRIEALPGRESDVENFRQQGLGIVEQEPNTVRWFASRFGPSSFGIYHAFPDDSGRRTHLSGQVAQALADNTGTLFAQPGIEPVDVIAEKPLDLRCPEQSAGRCGGQPTARPAREVTSWQPRAEPRPMRPR